MLEASKQSRQQAALPDFPPGQVALREAPPHPPESSNKTLSALCPSWTWAWRWGNLPSPFYRLFREEPENNKRPAWVRAAQDGGGQVDPGRGPPRCTGAATAPG